MQLSRRSDNKWLAVKEKRTCRLSAELARERRCADPFSARACRDRLIAGRPVAAAPFRKCRECLRQPRNFVGDDLAAALDAIASPAAVGQAMVAKILSALKVICPDRR